MMTSCFWGSLFKISEKEFFNQLIPPLINVFANTSLNLDDYTIPGRKVLQKKANVTYVLPGKLPFRRKGIKRNVRSPTKVQNLNSKLDLTSRTTPYGMRSI